MILSNNFLNKYKKTPKFGFGDMSEFVFKNKYARIKADGKKEEFWEVIQRNVEGIFRLLDKYADHTMYQSMKKDIAEEMYDHMYNLRFLPAGRPLANVGTPIIDEKEWGAALNNCSFVSFTDVASFREGFEFVIDMSMKGVGVGIEVTPYEALPLHRPTEDEVFVIPDTTEGWTEAVGRLVDSYVLPDQKFVVFDYSQIRPKGSPIRGIENAHTGAEPLRNMLNDMREILEHREKMDSRTVADLCNLIGACVVSGGQRRTALLFLGDASDEDYIDLKDTSLPQNKYREKFHWTSNNSIYAKVGMDYDIVKERVAKGTDLGLIWIENIQQYGRMCEPKSFDAATGVNPCAEMGLESFELCNLVELNPLTFGHSDNLAKSVILSAVFYAKVISLVPTSHSKTNEIMARNRRFGLSQTGIVEYLDRVGKDVYRQQLEEWYVGVQECDRFVSRLFNVTPSIRTTTVKPSGSISKVMGTTAGIHFAPAKYYIRRVRVKKGSGYDEYYRQKGYHVEDDIYDYNGNTSVISFIISNENIQTIDEVTARDQIELAAFMQKYWSDNAVSITVTFEEDEIDDMFNAVVDSEIDLKSLSFLRKENHGYSQAPQEKISYEAFMEELEKIKERRVEGFIPKIILPDADVEEYCTADSCISPVNQNI